MDEPIKGSLNDQKLICRKNAHFAVSSVQFKWCEGGKAAIGYRRPLDVTRTLEISGVQLQRSTLHLTSL